MSLAPDTIIALARNDVNGVNIIPNASVEIKDITNTTHVDIFGSNANDGVGSEITQPTTVDDNGTLNFWAEPGYYMITVAGQSPYVKTVGGGIAISQTEIDNYLEDYNFSVDSVAELIAGSFTQDQIYVRSYHPGWAATAAGPRGGFLCHRTGGTNTSPTVGTAVPAGSIGGGDGSGDTTGQQAQVGYFYDAGGRERRLSPADGVVLPEQFGSVSDGSADDSQALNDALYFHAFHSLKLIVSNRHTHTSGLVCVTSNQVSIEFVGAGELITSASMSEDVGLWISWLPWITNASRNTYWDKSLRTGGIALSSDAVGKQDKTITLADTSTITAGDYIRIASTEQYVQTRTQYDKGEIRRVGSVSGNDVTLDGVLDDSYLAASTHVFLLDPPSVSIKNLRMTGPDNGNDYKGCVLWECVNVTLESPQCSGYNDAGIEFAFVSGYKLSNANCDFSQKAYVTSGRTSYSFNTSSSRDGLISGGQFRGGRHSFATGGYDPNRNIRVLGATIYGNDQYGNDVAVMDSHENMDGLHVEKCKIYGGVNLAGQNISFENNEVILSGEALRVCEIRVAKSCDFMKMNGNTIVSEDGSAIGGLVLRSIWDGIIVRNVEQDNNVVILDTSFSRPGIGIEPASAGTNFKIEKLSQDHNQVSVSGTGNSPGIGNYDTGELADVDRPIISHHTCKNNYITNENWRCIDFDPNPASGNLYINNNTCETTTGNSSCFNIRRYKKVFWLDNEMLSNANNTGQNVFNSIDDYVSIKGGLITYSAKNGFDATGLDIREIDVTRENCTVDDADWTRRNAKFIAHSWASVQANGTNLATYGCSVSKTGTGTYRVTFDAGNRQENSTDYPVITNPACTSYSRTNFNSVVLTFSGDTDFSFVSF